MMPEAPVRFSTMNCCLSDSVSFAANTRASGSTEPPGGYGETNLTTFVGQSCAHAAAAQNDRMTVARSLETDIPSSFELQHRSRVVGRRDLQAELLEEAARLRHLLGVRVRRAGRPRATGCPRDPRARCRPSPPTSPR